jgi:pimeloyl-ACP methyl ester carboxylesterase
LAKITKFSQENLRDVLSVNSFETHPNDHNSPWQLTEAYHQSIHAPAGKRLVWFENSAHDIFFDQPRQLEQEVLTILETHGQP